MRLNKALQLLELEPDASARDVRDRWRDLRSTLHPDRGGDPDQFILLREAYEAAFHELSKPKPCPVCDGAGKVTVSRGWTKTKLRCNHCGGTGEAPNEESTDD